MQFQPIGPPNTQFYQYNQVPYQFQVIQNNQYPIQQNFGNQNYFNGLNNQPHPLIIAPYNQNQNSIQQGQQYLNMGNGQQNQIIYPNQNPQSIQILANQNQLILSNSLIDAERLFWKVISQQVILYIFLIMACIIIQYVCCGSKKASQLVIKFIKFSLIFLIATMALVKYTGMIRRIQILYISYFLYAISIVLEIAAFAIAVQNPPILIVYLGDQRYTQTAGNCLLYSDDEQVYFEKYSGGLQYGCLAFYILQFLHSFLILYFYIQKGSSYFQFIKQNLILQQQIVPIRQ